MIIKIAVKNQPVRNPHAGRKFKAQQIKRFKQPIIKDTLIDAGSRIAKKHAGKDQIGEVGHLIANTEYGKKFLGASQAVVEDAKSAGRFMMAHKKGTAAVAVPLAVLIGARAAAKYKKHQEDMQIPEYLR